MIFTDILGFGGAAMTLVAFLHSSPRIMRTNPLAESLRDLLPCSWTDHCWKIPV
jgi:hypothetical protein